MMSGEYGRGEGGQISSMRGGGEKILYIVETSREAELEN
jgi:hypothetical protein